MKKTDFKINITQPRRIIIVLMISISISVFALQSKKNTPVQQPLQPNVELQQQENDELRQRIDMLEAELKKNPETIEKKIDDYLDHWINILAIIMAILGIAMPLIISIQNEKNTLRLVDEATKKADSAREKANEVERLKQTIDEMKQTMDGYLKKSQQAANEAKASELFSQALSEKDPSKAIELYTEAIRIRSNFYEAYVNRSVSRAEVGMTEEAIEDLNMAINLQPREALAYANRGVLRKKTGDRDGAMQDYDKAIELNPKYSNTYNNRGVLKKEKGDKDGAMQDYNMAIKLDPQNAGAYNNRADLLLLMGEYNDALEDVNRAIQYDPKHFEFFHTRGEIYMGMEEYELAVTDFTEALRINDKSKESYLKRAKCLRKLAESEKDSSKKNENSLKAKLDEEMGHSTQSLVDHSINRIGAAVGKKIINLKRNVYCSDDGKIGYIYCESKAYEQGDRLKYWYGYRPKTLELIKRFDEQNMIYCCRDTRDLLLIPVKVIEEHLPFLSVSIDDNGGILHWHIVLIRDKEGHINLLRPKSEVKEINLDEYIIP